MKDTPFQQVPLSGGEKDLLLTVYRTRRRIIISAFGLMMLIGLYTSFRAIDPYRWSNRYAYGSGDWNRTRHQDPKENMRLWLISVAAIETILIGSGIYTYSSYVAAFKKDADSGMKEKVPYTIMRKEYFPLTDQYYVAFNDPKYLHHEIDADTYNRCEEGGAMYIYRAIKTKFVFEDSGRFTLI